MAEKKRGFHALEERVHQLEEEHEKEQKQTSGEKPEEKAKQGEKPLKT